MANFSVAARTLIHLGAELITSDEVALNELIKNSFDADSKRVRIDFRRGLPQAKLDEFLEQARNVKKEAIDKFLADVSSELLAEGERPEGDSVRAEALVEALAVASNKQQMAEVLETINTISITDRGSGMDRKILESVFLRIGTPSRLTTPKSEMNRSILGNKGIGRLAMMRLGDRAIVTSWASRARAHRIDFDWRHFDDPNRGVDDVPIDVVKASPKHDGNSGTVIEIAALCDDWSKERVEEGFVKAFLRRLQNPFKDMSRQAMFPIDVHYNDGERIAIEGMKKLLSDHAQADLELNFTPAVKDPTDTVVAIALADHQRGIDPKNVFRNMNDVARKVGATPQELLSIGPFSVRIRWFNRDTLRTVTKLHGTTNEAKKELDLWSGGVAIYRDGFRVGFSGDSSGEDWLEIDSSALKQGGYAVNRIQVVGALEISHKNNPKLIDRSNREGLIESRQVNLVREILAEYAIGELRNHIQHEGAEERRAVLDEVAKSAPESIQSRIKQAEKGLAEIRVKAPPDTRKTVKSISDHLHFIKSETKRFEQAAKQVTERREDILELAGVGTVMSGVLHELTRTTGHTQQLMQKLAKKESTETRALLTKLDNEIKAINTRLRQLDPLTPSGRHRKGVFDLTALLRTILDGYEARFERHHIKAMLTVDDQDTKTPFNVNMVRGFVSLAVENLITNSVYWLQQYLKAGQTNREIHLELDTHSKTLTVWDNGPGIAPADKDRVFTPGFSMRRGGQGLGLYLAAEIAAYHNAQLVLDHADEDGRFRYFVLQMPKE